MRNNSEELIFQVQARILELSWNYSEDPMPASVYIKVIFYDQK